MITAMPRSPFVRAQTVVSLAAVPLCLLLLAVPSRAVAAEVTAGGVAGPTGFLGGAGVEIGGADWGLELAGAFLAYEYREEGYEESGAGPVAGIRARYYAQDTGNATRLWLGGGLSFAQVEYEWKEHASGVLIDDGTTETSGVLVHAGAGYKLLFLDERLVADPQVFLGWLAADTDANLVAGAGVSLGWRF